MKEDHHIEWKQSWRDEYLKHFCGFANPDDNSSPDFVLEETRI